MKHIANIGWILILSVLLVSCKKYLDEKPDSKIVTPSTLNDLQALLDNANYLNEKGASFDEASADDYYNTQARYNSYPLPNNRLVYTWGKVDYNFPNDWANLYNVVYTSNLCLELIEKLNPNDHSPGAWNNVKGSALFHRANSFYQLIKEFGKAYDESSPTDLGIPLRLSSDFNIPSVRSSVKESYDRIVADLKEAISLLPGTMPQYQTRPAKAAACALLSRTYLAMRMYADAFKYADSSLKLKNDLIDYNTIDATLGLPFQKLNTEVLFHLNMQPQFSNVTPTNAKIDTVLFASYATNDIRKAAFFTQVADGIRFKGMYSGSTVINFTGITTAEMYLTRAECYARMGDKDAAMADLNYFLKFRWKKVAGVTTYVDQTAATPAEALAKVLVERRRELVMRNFRWMDIKRLNKEGAGITPTRFVDGQFHTLPPNDNRYALPLPTDVINLTGIPQNPR